MNIETSQRRPVNWLSLRSRTEIVPTSFGMALGLALLVPGCLSGGQTGTEGGPDDCGVPLRPLDVQEESALGFSAADILAYAEGTHVEELEWNEQSAPVTVGPETGESQIEITITHGDRAVWGPDDDQADPYCVGLQIDVLVTVRSAGGALDEQFEASLATREQDRAYVYADFGLADVQGALQVEGLPSDPGWRLHFNLDLSPSGTEGSMWLQGTLTEECNDDGECSGSLAAPPLARIGPAPGS